MMQLSKITREQHLKQSHPDSQCRNSIKKAPRRPACLAARETNHPTPATRPLSHSSARETITRPDPRHTSPAGLLSQKRPAVDKKWRYVRS